MNILVFVKQVPKDEDLRLDPETKNLVRNQSSGQISEYDKYSMELALRLKEALGGKVTAVTMGPPQSENVLRHCLALGADNVYLLSDRAMGGADAYATVNVLAMAKKYLEERCGTFDLILCGKQASDSDTSLVMPELAEALDLPQFSNVIDYELIDGTVCFEHETESGSELAEITLPAVLGVSKTVFSARYPNIRLKLMANRRTIESINASELGADPHDIGTLGSKTVVGASYFPVHDKATVVIHEENDGLNAMNLFEILQAKRVI